MSISHYSFIHEVVGFRWQRSNDYTFEIVTSDGRHLSFDAGTGKRVETADGGSNRQPPRF